MRIYLDTSIFQDLKKEEHAQLLALVNADKEKNVYRFSEAHLYDLNRDTTDIKFDDMKLMEEIVGRQCFSFDDKLLHPNLTPTEYYESYDWSTVGNVDIKEILKSNFGKIPLNLSEIIKMHQIPEDCPQSFVELLSKTTNLYEFMEGMLDFTDDLSDGKTDFRDMLRYLHKNSLIKDVYESLGIKGFDGNNVFDLDLFRGTYLELIKNSITLKGDYNFFIMVYNCLEIYGIVKGKPKKQRMPNLRDDSRHAFFGASCDLIVSKDEDFVNKTKFIYKLFGFDTVVMNSSEFESYLTSFNPENDTLVNLLRDIRNRDENLVWEKWIDEETNKTYYERKLNALYYGMFNTLTFVKSAEVNYCFLSRGGRYYHEGTYGKEIEYVTNKLVLQLGEDLNGNSAFDKSELLEEEWIGRDWEVEEIPILLTIQDGSLLLFFEFGVDEANDIQDLQ